MPVVDLPSSIFFLVPALSLFFFVLIFVVRRASRSSFSSSVYTYLVLSCLVAFSLATAALSVAPHSAAAMRAQGILRPVLCGAVGVAILHLLSLISSQPVGKLRSGALFLTFASFFCATLLGVLAPLLRSISPFIPPVLFLTSTIYTIILTVVAVTSRHSCRSEQPSAILPNPLPSPSSLSSFPPSCLSHDRSSIFTQSQEASERRLLAPFCPALHDPKANPKFTSARVLAIITAAQLFSVLSYAFQIPCVLLAEQLGSGHPRKNPGFFLDQPTLSLSPFLFKFYMLQTASMVVSVSFVLFGYYYQSLLSSQTQGPCVSGKGQAQHSNSSPSTAFPPVPVMSLPPQRTHAKAQKDVKTEPFLTRLPSRPSMRSPLPLQRTRSQLANGPKWQSPASENDPAEDAEEEDDFTNLRDPFRPRTVVPSVIVTAAQADYEGPLRRTITRGSSVRSSRTSVSGDHARSANLKHERASVASGSSASSEAKPASSSSAASQHLKNELDPRSRHSDADIHASEMEARLSDWPRRDPALNSLAFATSPRRAKRKVTGKTRMPCSKSRPALTATRAQSPPRRMNIYAWGRLPPLPAMPAGPDQGTSVRIEGAPVSANRDAEDGERLEDSLLLAQKLLRRLQGEELHCNPSSSFSL